ncbi:Potassium efflux system KefA protein / Small-conductance mechanosensitive channel [Chitinispirillum alkaliphilum]|nr:Potassium efflux system KefA protein / Small-conductance mechanosensitive channel [Chitinispirillum alkaliphilum]
MLETQFPQWYPFISLVLRVAIIIIVSFVIFRSVMLIIGKYQKSVISRLFSSQRSIPAELEKRVDTLGKLLRKVSFVTVFTIASLMILDEFGIDIKALLAGLGIVGIAVGFGAQNLVKDVISGLFIIIENHIRVGDVAILNGTGGLVEQVNLRTTVLRSADGVLHVFHNGSINTLSNMTYEFSYYVFDIGVAYKEDTDQVCRILQELGDEMMSDPEYKDLILEPMNVLGVDKFEDSAVMIKARIKTLPIKQWMVGRELNRRIKKRFDEEGIEIPFPHRTLYFGSTDQENKENAMSLTTEKVKSLINEQLDIRLEGNK